MKNFTRIILSLVLVACLGRVSFADTTPIFTANFADDTLSVYNYSGGPDPTASVKGGALVFTADLSPANANAGVRWTQTNTSKNTDSNLADYTLSFDLAVTKGTLTNVTAGLTIAGISTDNANESIDLSKLNSDGSFAHYSMNLGDSTVNQFFNAGATKLDPTASTFSFEFATFGNSSGVVTFQIKNLKITRVTKDSSSSVTNKP